MMEVLKKSTLPLSVLLVLFSCMLKEKHLDVDSFYKKSIHLDFPVLPLEKPIFAYYDKAYDEWFFDFPDFFNNKLYLENLKKIGIENTYIYGKTNKRKRNIYKYEKGKFVYANKYNGISISKEPSNLEGELQIFPIDSIKNTFEEPERWFIINVADSSTTAFFSKKKYKDYLKSKGISGKMYDIDKYHKQYKETGILPWFPDSVQVQLRK